MELLMIKSLRALCFLVYDQVQGIKQWKEMPIFIKGLLEDNQWLSMGEMLTVNFRQPSHEFTFNVGIDLLF
jgi:hypothetical protein